MSQYTQEQVNHLIDGALDWDTTLRMLTMPKDAERFQMYIKALQAKTGLKDAIVLPLGPHLYIVSDAKTKNGKPSATAATALVTTAKTGSSTHWSMCVKPRTRWERFIPTSCRPTLTGRSIVNTTAPPVDACTTWKRQRLGIQCCTTSSQTSKRSTRNGSSCPCRSVPIELA